MKRLAVFASGSGSNAENIIRYFRKNGQAEICCIVSNRPDAFVLERARLLKVPAAVFSRDEFLTGEAILNYLNHSQVHGVILAGFLLKIPSLILENFPSRILNIHPALLPAYGGKGMYGMRVHEAVIRDGQSVSGITIHRVNENYDEGEILFQGRCEVYPSDTPESLATRVHELEYAHYPRVIEEFLRELHLEGI